MRRDGIAYQSRQGAYRVKTGGQEELVHWVGVLYSNGFADGDFAYCRVNRKSATQGVAGWLEDTSRNFWNFQKNFWLAGDKR